MRRHGKSGDGVIICGVLVVVALLGLFCVWPAWFHAERNTVDVVVQEKERVHSEGGGYYLIFTDKGPYKCTDSLWEGIWDSSDTYNDIHIGEHYRFHVYGFRIPLLSEYETIYAFEKLELEE